MLASAGRGSLDSGARHDGPGSTTARRPATARLAFPYRHKILVLIFAYACIAGVFVCLLMAPWRQPDEEEILNAPDLKDPCSWGILLHSRHIGKEAFFKKRCAAPSACSAPACAAPPTAVHAQHDRAMTWRTAAHAWRLRDVATRAVRDPEYHEMVWRAVTPQPHHIERFAMSSGWAPYAPSGKARLPKRELMAGGQGPSEAVVLMLQASPDRCATRSSRPAHAASWSTCACITVAEACGLPLPGARTPHLLAFPPL